MAAPKKEPPQPTDERNVVELRRAVRQADTGAFLVEARVVRRAIRELHGYARLAARIPHTELQVVRAVDVRRLAHPDELGLESFRNLPDPVTLIALPEENELDTLPPQELMLRIWRHLFHGAVDRAIQANLKSRRLTPALVQAHIDAIGQVEFDEAHAVLVEEQRLIEPESRVEAFAEFAAVWWELSRFAPDLIPIWFPSLADRDRKSLIPNIHVDPNLLYVATRLEGAAEPDPTPQIALDEAQLSGVRQGWFEGGQTHPSSRKYARLQRRRERASEKGNTVAAGVAAMKAAEYAPSPAERRRSLCHADDDVAILVGRLQQARLFDDDDVAAWRASLTELFRNSTHGFWNADKKLLYDLQKVCLDHERITYKVDLVKWIVSRGQRPLRRPLTNIREVTMAKHLSSSASRLVSVRLSGSERDQLASLLHEATHLAEQQMRDRMRPALRDTLLDVGFRPDNVPEHVAFDKLIEESLDCIAQRGYLTMGYLRDTISRNDLKLADIEDPKELIRGDQLLRSDDRLDVALDGVYRRGEFYLRWLQIASSLAFGTGAGRFLTLWVAIPFGGALIVVEGMAHLIDVFRGAGHETANTAPTSENPPDADTSAEQDDDAANPDTDADVADWHGVSFDAVPVLFRPEPTAAASSETASWETVGVSGPLPVDPLLTNTTRLSLIIAIGLVIMALIHLPKLRHTMRRVLSSTWSALRYVLWDIPSKVVRLPLVQYVWRSRIVVLFRRTTVSPLIVSWAVCRAIPWLVNGSRLSVGWVVLLALPISVALNSRAGRDTEELAAEWIGNLWHHLRARVFVALFDWIVDFFKWLMTMLERVIYAVDEWLRFHNEETWMSLVVKAVVGVAWSLIVFFIRIYVNLLIEPQINPIKHFPVVTVSHKIILPITIWAHPKTVDVLDGFLGAYLANSLVGATLFLLPGVFGFLVWELKENWRLYSSNRVERLQPVIVGSHGETVGRLVRPGFHSGTVPKAFSRLRRLERQPPSFRRFSQRRAWQNVLYHAERDMRRFAERDLIRLLDYCPVWENAELFVSAVDASSNSVLVSIDSRRLDGGPVQILFQEQNRWVVASVARRGLLDQVTGEQLHSFDTALLGFYRKAGADLVREQMERNFIGSHPYDVCAAGLVIWPDRQFDQEVVADLNRTHLVRPVPLSLARSASLDTRSIDRVVFARSRTTWDQWVGLWHVNASAEGEEEPPLACMPSASLSLLAQGSGS